MATKYINLPAHSGWVEASTAGDWLVQNVAGASLHVTVQASAPSATDPFHDLRRGEGVAKVGTGNVYVRNPESYSVEVPVTE